MKFIEGLKCIIVMLLIGFILNIMGIMICNTAAGVIASIFNFLNPEITSTIRDVLKGIFHLVWFVIAVIAIIHAFKIKYLDKHTITKEIKTNENKTESKDNNEVKEDVKVIENEKPFEFLEALAKIVIIFIKIFVAWIILGIVFSTIGLIVATIIVLPNITVNILFVWMLLLLLASTIVSIQIIILLIKFIFNKKVNAPLNIIIFISCVVLAGASIGLIALTIRNIKIVNDNSCFNITTETKEIEYKDYLVLEQRGVGFNHKYKFIKDDSIEENKILLSRDMDTKYFELYTTETEIDNMPTVKVTEEMNADIFKMYDFFINGLKKNKIYTFENYGDDPLVIKANTNTINKLIENMRMVYLTEEEYKDNEINVLTHGYKVYFKTHLEGDYNAITDTITNTPEGYSCMKETESTQYGDRTIYTCDYKEEEE
jgi:hypothetical protein